MKNEVIRKIAKAIEIPSELVDNTSRFEVFGNREAVIDGCKGIIEYSDSVVKLSTLRYGILISGQKLLIKNYDGESVTVEGILNSFEFIY